MSSNKLLWLLGGFFLIWIGVGVYMHQKVEVPILKPAVAVKAGPKRYVIWNKTALLRGAPHAKEINAASFAAYGAKNIKPLELINGATYEAEPAQHADIKAMTDEGGEWVVQEEVEYGILMGAAPSVAACWQSNGPLVSVPCPGAGVTPGPGITPGPQPRPEPAPDKSWGRTRVHAIAALKLISTKGVKICDTDTGIDLTHPNRGNVVASADFTGQGVQDGNGHGTHTAGTLAGTSGVGISEAQLLICKGLTNQGSGSSSSLAQCLAWCAQQGAQISSNSWGSPQSDPLINQAIAALSQKGIYVFIAAGNDSGPVNWPAKLAGSTPLVYAIAASDQSDQITSFSSRGTEVRFISPGDNIVSNWPGGGTRALAGTSMATPHAAAICAFGIARGRKPCVRAVGTVSGYPFADAEASASSW